MSNRELPLGRQSCLEPTEQGGGYKGRALKINKRVCFCILTCSWTLSPWFQAFATVPNPGDHREYVVPCGKMLLESCLFHLEECVWGSPMLLCLLGALSLSLVVLRMEPRALCRTGKYSTSELRLQPGNILWLCKSTLSYPHAPRFPLSQMRSI